MNELRLHQVAGPPSGPTLLLRDADFERWSHGTARAMAARGPAPLHEFGRVGRAPPRVRDDRVGVVRCFLSSS